MKTVERSPEPSLQEIVLARVLLATAAAIAKWLTPARQVRGAQHVKMAVRPRGPPGIAGARVLLATVARIAKR